eukprot:TRINITY_DN14030_c0_g1_i1.p1 TRINITY_DN14030_c0_g1~~TRINITY_DN14030_c0_g1_i1.p1  ORF type:complete len:547 (+),score=114.29 TRINITY_DN14030_c0_g1_i1:40-1641(+)
MATLTFSLYTIVSLVAAVFSLLFSTIFVRMYSSKEESSFGTRLVATFNILLTLLFFCLIPLDILNVSENTGSSYEFFGNIINIAMTSGGIVLVIQLFIITPFSYFYFEEKDEYNDNNTPFATALKYTIVFVIVLAVIIAFGTIMSNRDDATIFDGTKLENTFYKVLTFVIGFLCVLGFVGWAYYGSYGIVFIPLRLIFTPCYGKDNDMVEIKDYPLTEKKYKGKYKSAVNIERSNNNNIDDYDDYANKRQRLLRNPTKDDVLDSDDDLLGRASKAGKTCTACIRGLSPLMVILGIFALFLSLSVIYSLFVSIVSNYSDYGIDYKMPIKIPMINVFDKLFVLLSGKYLDYALLLSLCLVVIIGVLFGIRKMGIRFFCCEIFSIRAGNTRIQGILILGVIFAVTLFGFFQILFILMPNYVSFGSQTFPLYNSTDNNVIINNKEDCYVLPRNGSIVTPPPFISKEDYYLKYCRPTKFFIMHEMMFSHTFVSFVAFVSNIAFVVLSLLFGFWLTCTINNPEKETEDNDPGFDYKGPL